MCRVERVILKIVKKQPAEVFYEKRVFKNFAKFIGKQLFQSLFSNKVAGIKTETLSKKRI